MSQKALVLQSIGDPLVATTRPIPEPPADHVLVKVTAAGINPHDQMARDLGLFVGDNLPAILTNDVVGEIVKLGPSGIKDFKVGDHIFTLSNLALGMDHGGLQEYSLMDVNYSSKVPPNIKDAQAATIPVNTLAPYIALFTDTGLGIPIPGTDAAKSFDYKSQTLLIIGGGSSCGKFGVQLAKWAGIGRIIVVAGKNNEPQLRQFGATDFIDRHSPSLLNEIKTLTGDNLIYVFDSINSGDGLTLAVAALSNSKKGTVACLRSNPTADPAKIGDKTAGYNLNHIFGYSWSHPVAAGLFWREFMYDWLESGVLTPLGFDVVEGLDVERVNGVLDNYRDGKGQTKVHVLP